MCSRRDEKLPYSWGIHRSHSSKVYNLIQEMRGVNTKGMKTPYHLILSIREANRGCNANQLLPKIKQPNVYTSSKSALQVSPIPYFSNGFILVIYNTIDFLILNGKT
jgi:hypothetical protein